MDMALSQAEKCIIYMQLHHKNTRYSGCNDVIFCLVCNFQLHEMLNKESESLIFLLCIWHEKPLRSLARLQIDEILLKKSQTIFIREHSIRLIVKCEWRPVGGTFKNQNGWSSDTL